LSQVTIVLSFCMSACISQKLYVHVPKLYLICVHVIQGRFIIPAPLGQCGSAVSKVGGSHQRNFIGDMYNYAVFGMKPTYNTKSSSQVSSYTYQEFRLEGGSWGADLSPHLSP